MVDLGSAYQAALSGAAYFLYPDAGYLRLSGEDRLSFLQRQSSNDVRTLAPGQALLTVLTSPLARIIDVLYLLDEAGTLGILTLAGLGEATAKFLRSRIFFMDKVTLEQASERLLQIDLCGPQAGRAAMQLGCQRLPQENEVVESQYAGFDLRWLGLRRDFGLGWRLLAPTQARQDVLPVLDAAGALRLEPADLHLLRVELGLPSAGYEWSETYTPFETGLAAAVSGSKGCYTGQEVLARQVTYDKVVQRLCGLKLDREAQAGMKLQTGDGNLAGVVTSAVVSPRFGPIGLAVLRRPADQPGIRLQLGEMATAWAVVTDPGVWM